MKLLEIVFENLESIVIPTERIKEFSFGELEVVREPFYENEDYRTDYICLKIFYNNEEELIYKPNFEDEPLGMFISNPTSNRVEDRPNILGRIINHNDIVCIEMLDENEKRIKNMYVPWSEKNEYCNEYMFCQKNNGVLEILIKKDINFS